MTAARKATDTGTAAGDSGDSHDRDDSSTHQDPREYIIHGQDSKGHSERVWCRVMPGHHRALGMVLASRQFPFRTMGDVIRWCIDFGLRELHRREGSGPSVLRQVDVTLEILRDEMYQQEFSRTFADLQTVVSRHQANGADGEARRIVAITKQNFEQMPEGYWQERYLSELQRQFGHLLEGEGVKLR